MQNQHCNSVRSLMLTALTVLPSVASFAQQQRPNILYIMSDDHAFQAISAYGSDISKLAPTPNIDRIAQQGLRFERAFVENSLSAPSRACTITGLYSHQNGQKQLQEGIDSTKTFVSELLQRAGYYTGVVGKWHLYCMPKGFNDYHVLKDQGTYYNPVFMSPSTHGKYVEEEGYATNLITKHSIDFLNHRDPNKPFFLMVHHKAPHRSWLPSQEHLGMYDNVTFPVPETFKDNYATRGSAVRTQKMDIVKDMQLRLDLKVSEQGNPKASAAQLVYEYPRMNADQRASMVKYYDQRNENFCNRHLTGDSLAMWKYQAYLRDYLATIKSVDESVGELLDYLKKEGLLENTIVIYTSDQGFYMGEHGWFDKRFMYEESLRTPLVMMYPGHIKPGTVSTELVQNIDYAPTFLDLAGVKKPKEMSGRSLRPLFSTGANRSWRKSIYYHYYDYPAWHLARKHDGIRTDRFKLIHFYGKGGAGAQSENKYQSIPGSDEYRNFNNMLKSGYITPDPDINYNELYDLQNDPNELNNLWGKPGYEKITKKLQKQLDQYRKTLRVDEW